MIPPRPLAALGAGLAIGAGVGAFGAASIVLAFDPPDTEYVDVQPERFTAVEEVQVPPSANETVFECTFEMATGDEVPESDDVDCTIVAEASTTSEVKP